MKLKDFKLLIIFSFICSFSHAQNKVFGIITEEGTDIINKKVFIYDDVSRLLTTSNKNGYYEFYTNKKEMNLIFLLVGNQFIEKKIKILDNIELNIFFPLKTKELSEVIIKGQKIREFKLKRLKDVEETAIYAGKKTEVILVKQSMANLASNNSRQVYSQISGLNIYQNDDAGLQLNIGGRGLDPNRTSNFNTRQNGYDISADVLGYPESYYTPPSEALKEIQIIRGAASLQYGTQFGGLLNFIMQEPVKNKKIEFTTRNTLGSNKLFTNFSSISGTKNKISYFAYSNYKKGNGFRINSNFNSFNYHFNIGIQINEKSKLLGEISSLKYLAKQAGGLTDTMFKLNHLQSNRSRNWFRLNWFLYNIKFLHTFSAKKNFSLNIFGLDANRESIGFRSNRVSQIDPNNERDLIKGNFNNYGFESRILQNYKLAKIKGVSVFGIKFYKSKTTSKQGPGSKNFDDDFNFYINQFPNYQNQSEYKYPNTNVALFGENIFYLNEKLSLTPGIRFEKIITKSDGFYKKINLDAAGNVILNEINYEKKTNKRSFFLLGLGLSYKNHSDFELYSNISQNYRSVTFTDISIINPAFSINPNITDEKGFTTDIGIRGNYNKLITYDLTAFNILYDDRIGFVQKVFNDGSIKSERGNIGNAIMYGLESLIDIDFNNFFVRNNNISLNYFINTSIIDSRYISSTENGVVGKKVEFVPNINIKTGIKLGYNNFILNMQYSYLSKQFTDSSNAIEGNISGVIGQIPSYDILDMSASYVFKKIKIEAGINNLTNNSYFTRRATGYPGPGIIPSPPRNIYFTIEIKI